MAQLAIKGHATRGEEVIEILEMLGGENVYKLSGTNEKCAYYKKNGVIHNTASVGFNNFKLFTLEEFLEKYPYKIGDKVIYTAGIGFIQKCTWDEIDNDVTYIVNVGDEKWLTDAKHLQPYKEESINKANKVVFDTNAQCCDIMNHIIKEKSMEEIKIDIPKGYEFAGVDDDNQQVVFTKIGYHYPNTYEECCEVLFPNSLALGKVLASGYNCELLERLGKLLICRDAYWKIAGDWKPNFVKEGKKFILACYYDKIYDTYATNYNRVLAFPTEEMRDAFYENFKELIEECKELL